MLSLIAIGLIVVVCYVADSEEVFDLSGLKHERLWNFKAPDGFLSHLTAGTYKFKLQPNWDWEFEESEDGGQSDADGIIFVLDLNKQDGCKFEYDNHYFLQHTHLLIKLDLMVINKEMNCYSARDPRYEVVEKTRNQISVGLIGDLTCPKDLTYALTRSGLFDRPYHSTFTRRGGANDYLKGERATGFVLRVGESSVGEDLMIGDKWPDVITDFSEDVITDFSEERPYYHFDVNVIVCRLHPSICVLYKRSRDDTSKYELQNMDDENKKLREHNRRLQIGEGNGSSDKNNESSSPDRRRGSTGRGRGSTGRGRGSTGRGRGSSSDSRSRSRSRSRNSVAEVVTA